MNIIFAILGGILIYLLLLTFLSSQINEKENLTRRIHEVENMKGTTYLSLRQETLEKPFFDRTVRPVLGRIGKRMKKTGETSASDIMLRQQLNQAGSMLHPTEYKVLRIVLTLITTALAIVVVVFSEAPLMNRLIFIILGIAGPYIIMRFLLTSSITRRHEAIDRQLPDVLDMLSVSVEVGLGFEQAIDYIVSQMEGPLVDEFAITSREISMGRDRRSAFILFGERCGAESVKSFVSILVQSIDMGISMKILLSSQAASMRLRRKRSVEEKAMKLSTKLLFPLVIFIFPVLLIILLGPALMNILQTF